MQGPLDQWLGYRDCLPLRIEPLSSEPSAAQIERWHDQNLRTLHAVCVLDERHQRADVTGKSLEDEVERLHQKLDVVLELLGTVLRASRPPAPEVPLRLSREGLCWTGPDLPPAGAAVLVTLDLHPCAPMPLCWPAQVLGMHEGEVCARFREMSDALAAALERLVFIRHRRSVAGSRSPGSSHTP
ncbi:PilZ domain-containing protein [Fontimonas sp. SYSU GA230001]|uniref:PilZ domain-containing protein n=1 Tax=Fontimonas sp. SYSU GA230001 TaxID=3142450 RepID=UPI0032B576BB